MNKQITEPLIREGIEFTLGRPVQISVVGYEHPAGIPARFLAGFIPAVALSNQLSRENIDSMIRIVDPTAVANHCNGWQSGSSRFHQIISDFLHREEAKFFIDQAEQISETGLETLELVGSKIVRSQDPQIVELVSRIQASGEKHGGENGRKNSILYLAAHPFSWSELYHPSIWKTKPDNKWAHVNLMSKAEERFSLMRKLIVNDQVNLSSEVNPRDVYMSVCNTPCYMLLEGEPTFDDFLMRGHEWCRGRYSDLKRRNRNYERIARDFEVICSHLRLN